MIAIVLGSTGYTGELLLRLLDEHPHVERIYAVSQSRSGAVWSASAPQFEVSDKLVGYLSSDELPRLKADVLFSALPHLKSTEVWREMVGKMIIIDLAADLRIPDAELFESRYAVRPPSLPGEVAIAYGIPELYREQVSHADVIANPGCFPTAGLIPLVPLARAGLLQSEIVVNAITGISGAGKSIDPNYLFSARSENVGAYKPGNKHRHWAEFQHYLPGHQIQFTPHLAPLSRGISATISCRLRSGADEKDLIYSYAQAYSSTPFIRYVGQYGNDTTESVGHGEVPATHIPQTADVRGSNRCDFSWQIDSDGRLLLFSVIDNLMKGASGQAIQNMNVRLGLAEDAGLPRNAEM